MEYIHQIYEVVLQIIVNHIDILINIIKSLGLGYFISFCIKWWRAKQQAYLAVNAKTIEYIVIYLNSMHDRLKKGEIGKSLPELYHWYSKVNELSNGYVSKKYIKTLYEILLIMGVYLEASNIEFMLKDKQKTLKILEIYSLNKTEYINNIKQYILDSSILKNNLVHRNEYIVKIILDKLVNDLLKNIVKIK